ncbi:MAG: PAS domain-containing protein, partial [SAR202 cluster bacterium]|nr:PAS domain-containing protein [SAR202 cluster bacterium]
MRAPRWQARVSAPAWMEKLRRCLYPYRPRLKDWRFWAVQVLVLIIAGTHTTAEVMSWLGHPIFLGSSPRIALASMVTVSLFFVPVVYAALNFGFAGAVATAVWCTALTLPNLIWFHDGMEKVREALQIGTVDAIAVFVGQRVEREMAERKRAEAASAALQASEARYRGLFESSPVPIILLDGSGSVLEANPAAGALFKRPAAGLKGAALGTLLSPAAAEHLLNPRPAVERNHEDTRLSLETDGARLYLEPSLTPIEDAAAA